MQRSNNLTSERRRRICSVSVSLIPCCFCLLWLCGRSSGASTAEWLKRLVLFRDSTMEISEVVNTQFVFPGLVVGLVLICAALVFVFGFKSVEDFPFDKLATVTDDRKPAGKKRKVKDKVKRLPIIF